MDVEMQLARLHAEDLERIFPAEEDQDRKEGRLPHLQQAIARQAAEIADVDGRRAHRLLVGGLQR